MDLIGARSCADVFYMADMRLECIGDTHWTLFRMPRLDGGRRGDASQRSHGKKDQLK